jgi:hypothetical protein
MRRFAVAIAAAAVLVSSTTSAFASPDARVRVDGHWVTDVAYGETWRGTLNGVDERVSDGSRVEYFRFNGHRDDCAIIEMNSANIDSYLELRFGRPDVTALRTDDDSGRGYNARIRMRLPASGTYYVFAGSSGSGADYGQYAVSVNRDTRGC